MCTVVLDTDGEVVAETVAELRRVWPTLVEKGAGVVEPSDDEDYCLCWIDLPGSARVNGARVRKDSDTGDYIIVSGQEAA